MKILQLIEQTWNRQEKERLNEEHALQHQIQSNISRMKMMIKSGKSFVEIGRVLGLHPDTISAYARRP